MIYSILMNVTWAIFFGAFFLGYCICYFCITPFLLSKHKKTQFFQSLVYESLYSEFHLKKLMKQTDDKYVLWTFKTIKYSKISIIISLPLAVIFSILQLN